MSQRIFPLVAVVLISVTFTGVYAQQEGEKKVLAIEDYARWRSIGSTSISDNGSWMTFAYQTPNADDTLYVRSLVSDEVYMIPRGQQPLFSDDCRWVAYLVATSHDEAEKLREQRKPVPQQAELMDLATGEKITWENAASGGGGGRGFRRGRSAGAAPSNFGFPEGSSHFVLKKAKLDSDAEHNGTDLILRNLGEGYEELIGSVSMFRFNKPGTFMAYTVDAADRNGNGLYLIELSTGIRRPLDNDNLEYSQMTWNEEGTALAVLKGEKEEGNVQKDNTLVAFTQTGGRRQSRSVYDPTEAADFPDGYVISENGRLTWSEDLSTVFVGIREQEEEEEEEESDDPVANVDIWHWNDDRLQSVQMLQANSDRNFTYTSSINIKNGKFIRLADETMKNISLTRDGKWGVGSDAREYVSDWEENRADYYRVNTATGERTLMFTEQRRTLGLSPDSKYFLYWKDGNVSAYVLKSGRTVNLTQNAPVSFVDREYDHPGVRPPYGVAGWTEDGKGILLNHRYDIWLQPLDGSEATNLTGGAGTENEIRFRYIQLDREERSIDTSESMLLSAFGQWTKKAGFYNLNRGRLTELVYEDKVFGNPTKAKNADSVVYTVETFREFADYYVSGLNFAEPRRITQAIPWQTEYSWGYTELIEYTNNDGVRLQAVLAIPEGYEPGQKLPMLVDFYEKNSQNLNRYPRTISRDTPMFSKYISNGYLVLLPDVHFNTRTTHSDHLECVEAAINEVIELGYVDPDRIGLHGHSFSGQGSAYIATHSDIFAAICYGAGATNLVSDFNQLWKSSGSNQHRYDIYGQGRFGANIFDDLELYIEQSAVYHARNVTSPLLILHGIADGSVEWLQAVEFYNALRFNGKNVILCAYPGEGHHLSKPENQKDFQTRMEQFFDHYLKGEPAPDWMIKGVPFLKKSGSGNQR